MEPEDKLQALNSDREGKVIEMEQLLASADKENRELNEAEHARFDQLNAECDSLKGKIATEEIVMKHKAEVERAKSAPVLDRVVPPTVPAAVVPAAAANPKITIPATVKRWKNLKSFHGDNADVDAYTAGKFLLAIGGNQASLDWCNKHGIMSAAQQENVNVRGGYLVPDVLDTAIIDLRDTFGVFSRNARRVNMTSDVVIRPRRTGGLTTFFVGEGAASTESNKSWDRVTLSAKKLSALARISNELNEDAIISVADDLTQEIAFAFSEKIDNCGFLGDGTSSFGGMFGVSTKLGSINGVDDGGGLVLSLEEDMSGVILAEVVKCIGILPQFAQARAKWYCSTAVWGQVLLRLAAAAGGNTIATIEAGGGLNFLGFPVELTQVLPSSDTTSQIILLFGDLTLSSDFGDRRQTTIRFSDSAVVGDESVFENDEMAVIGTTRFDINNHSLGTASVAGPMIGLITAAS